MKGSAVKKSRKRLGMTQAVAAKRLGVSQTYLSLLENDKRKLTEKLARKAVSKLDLPPTVLPVNEDLKLVLPITNKEFVRELASFKYPGFSHLRAARKTNPVTVLLKALSSPDLEARLVEALPWLLLNFSDMQWDQLVDAAKVNDLQNRLGFLTSLAMRLARRRKASEQESLFQQRERALFGSKLAKLDSLCRESMTNAERKWLLQNRSPDAKRWNVLSDLSLDHLSYA